MIRPNDRPRLDEAGWARKGSTRPATDGAVPIAGVLLMRCLSGLRREPLACERRQDRFLRLLAPLPSLNPRVARGLASSWRKRLASSTVISVRPPRATVLRRPA